VAGLLLDKVGDLAGVVSCDGASPLYLAAMEGHEGVVRRLLRRLPVGTMVSAASYAGPDGQTALHAAVLLRETGK
jgi:ankyrin repeat protein